MQITGYKLQHALKELETAREVAAGQFGDNIMQFDSQADKLELSEVFARFTALEKKIAQLQVLQARYNLAVKVNVLGESMSLHEAVKLVGGAGRAEKMWRDAVKGNKSNRYYSPDTSRSKDTEYARRSVSVDYALQQAKFAAKVASAIREAIQVGNATAIESSEFTTTGESLDASLFES